MEDTGGVTPWGDWIEIPVPCPECNPSGSEDGSCSGSKNGATSEMCGGCDDCIRLQKLTSYAEPDNGPT